MQNSQQNMVKDIKGSSKKDVDHRGTGGWLNLESCGREGDKEHTDVCMIYYISMLIIFTQDSHFNLFKCRVLHLCTNLGQQRLFDSYDAGLWHKTQEASQDVRMTCTTIHLIIWLILLYITASMYGQRKWHNNTCLNGSEGRLSTALV